jgi:splicing factor 3B subunit 3
MSLGLSDLSPRSVCLVERKVANLLLFYIHLPDCFIRADYITVGSDSGSLVVLEFDPISNVFNKLFEEPFGKSGSRRTVPGQYLAVDPKGRALMISAMEKAKLVYILNRDADTNLTISSPLEAHKNNAIIHHIVALGVGFDNPLFAALEVDYTASDQDPTGEAFIQAQKVRTFCIWTRRT